ncbi:sensor histidine kinase [Nocardioides sp. NPDC004968]|uniref:sensor histidine kinase n=1 Tax=Nocardioides sp. NPDC004968 TaxID=3155894 RepID=UPI0033BEBDA8
MLRADDQRWILQWTAGVWLVFGLAPNIVAGLGDPELWPYWSSALVCVLALSYGIALRFPASRTWFLGVLVVGVGVGAFLRGGNAALFIVSVPHFWIFAGGPRRAIELSGAAAVSAVAGAVLRTGEVLTGNVVVTVLGYLASVLLGLAVLRVVRRSEERAARLDAELRATREQLASAHRREGAVEERERLAREIHDTLAQGFASIVVLAEAARSGLGEHDDHTSARQLRSIELTARENLAEARALVGASPAAGVVSGSIAETLRRTLDRFREDTGITTHDELTDIDCDQQTRIGLLRATQESLANVRKHAAASTVGLVLSEHPHGIELEITDDGRGFTVADSRGFGLDGMRRRLSELGGDLTITSSPGDGTRVLALLPPTAARHAEEGAG